MNHIHDWDWDDETGRWRCQHPGCPAVTDDWMGDRVKDASLMGWRALEWGDWDYDRRNDDEDRI